MGLRTTAGDDRAARGILPPRSAPPAELGLAPGAVTPLLDAITAAVIATDLDGRISYCNEAAARLYGYAVADLLGASVLDLLVSVDDQAAGAAVMDVVLAGEPWTGEFTVCCGDGTTRNIWVTDSPIVVDGQVVGVLGVAEDAHDRAAALREARRVLGRLDQLAAVTAELAGALDVETVIDIVVSRASMAAGASLASLSLVDVGEPDTIVLAGIRGGRAETAQRWARHPVSAALPASDAVRTKQPVLIADPAQLDARYPTLAGLTPGDRAVVCLPLVVRGHALGAITLAYDERRLPDARELTFLTTLADACAQAIDRVRALDAARERAARLEEAQRAQAFLLDASDALAAATGYADALTRLAGVAVPTLGDLCLIDVRDDDGRLRRVAARHADPARQPLADQLRDRFAPDPDGRHPIIASMAAASTRWSAEMSEEFLRETTRDGQHLALVKEMEFTSYMTVPLVADQQVLGTLTLVSAGSGRRFGEADVARAEEFAARVALVVAKERRYQSEHDVSHALQSNLLPLVVAQVDGVDVAVRYLAGTRDAEVGGDFFDVMPLGRHSVALAVGDVAGHDITAAATMAQLRSATRALRPHADGPAALVRLLHETWEHLGLDRIATGVFAELDVTNGALRMASAGHPAPLVVDGATAWFPAFEPGAPLGAPATDLQEWSGVLHPGTALVFYTDGLVEDRHRDIDDGTRRLLRAAVSAGTTEPDQLADVVLESLVAEERADDVALLVVRRRPDHPVSR